MTHLSFLIALVLLGWTVLHVEGQQTTVGGRTLRDNQWVVGNNDRPRLEDNTIKSYDDAKYSYYSILNVIRGYTAESDFLPQGIRGKQYIETCVAQAWATFDQLAVKEPTSSFYLLTHLTVPARRPLHQNRQLIYNCIVLKDPGTGTFEVASKTFNQQVSQTLRWQLGWDVRQGGKYGKAT